jgi:hypothetical protein
LPHPQNFASFTLIYLIVEKVSDFGGLILILTFDDLFTDIRRAVLKRIAENGNQSVTFSVISLESECMPKNVPIQVGINLKFDICIMPLDAGT